MENERKLIHTRNISCRGYRLSDNLYEIEGVLTDTKPFQTSSFDRNKIEPNEPIHEMVIRIKIDINFVIVDAESISKKTPYLNCGDVNKDFKKLIRLMISGSMAQFFIVVSLDVKTDDKIALSVAPTDTFGILICPPFSPFDAEATI